MPPSVIVEPVGPAWVLLPPGFSASVPLLVIGPVRFKSAAVPAAIVKTSVLLLPSTIMDEIVSVPEVGLMMMAVVPEVVVVPSVPPVMVQPLAAAANVTFEMKRLLPVALADAFAAVKSARSDGPLVASQGVATGVALLQLFDVASQVEPEAPTQV